MMTFLSRYNPKHFFTKLTALPAQPRVFGLDLMRALAILGVLFTHACFILATYLPIYLQTFAWLSGVLGVEAFFALSGFLIGSILLSLAPDFGNLRILPYFWQRRWFRTIPTYYLFTFISIASLFIMESFRSKHIPNILPYLTYILPYLAFIQNWLWPHPNFFVQAWSLAVEEWFYLLFPISLFLIYCLSRSFTVSFLVSAGIFIVIPTLVRIQWAIIPGISNWDETFRKIMFVRLDAIMYGVLAAWAKKRFPQTWIKSRFPLLVAGSLILYFTWSLASKQDLNSSFFAKTFLFSLFPLGFACLLPFFDHWKVSKENLLTHSFRLISLWSYSLYLCNLLVLLLIRTILQQIGQTSLPMAIILFVLFYIVCLLISSITYTYFEKPIMDLRENFSKANSLGHSHLEEAPIVNVIISPVKTGED